MTPEWNNFKTGKFCVPFMSPAVTDFQGEFGFP